MPGKFVVKKGPTGKFRFSPLDQRPGCRLERGVRDEARCPVRRRIGAEARRRREIVDTTVAVASAEAGGEAAAKPAAKKPAAKKPAAKKPAAKKPAARKYQAGPTPGRGAGPAPVSRSAASEAPDRERVGALHPLRLPAGGERLEVVGHHLTDLPPDLGHVPGPVGGEDRAGRRPGRLSWRDRLLGEDVDRGPDVPARSGVEERRPVDDRGARDSTTTEPAAIASKHAADRADVLGRDGGEDEDDLAAGEELEKRHRLDPERAQLVGGEPRIVREQLAAEGPEQRQQRAGEVAATDESDRLAGEEERAAVGAVVEHRLAACADLGVTTGNVPGRGERHPERELRDRLAEHRADSEHLDPAGEARGVVDVREEVALDVEHGLETSERARAGLPEARSGR